MDSKRTPSVDDLLSPHSTDSTSPELEVVAGFAVPVCDEAAITKINTSQSSTKSNTVSKRTKTILEIVILGAVILLVCGGFAIPTVFYALPSINGKSSNNDTPTNTPHLCLDDVTDGNSSQTLCLNTTLNGSNNSDIICAERFYLDSDSQPICIPQCSSWIKFYADDILFVATRVFAIFSSVILFVLLWPQRDTIMLFPTYYLIYACVNLDLIGTILIIGAVGKSKVFCGFESFIESSMNSTLFCTISGIWIMYGSIQITMFLTLHALGLCWSIKFPFHYRRFKLGGRIKYIHITTVILAVILPGFPALLLLIDGYSIGAGPIYSCIGRNVTVTYFSILLPTSILVTFITSIFVVLFWTILKEFFIKQLHQNKPKGYARRAEAKILVIMFYYVIMGTIALSSYYHSIATGNESSEAYQIYFSCQRFGVVPGRDCGDPPDLPPQVFNRLATISYFLHALLPVIVLIFIVNCSCNRRCCKYISERISKCCATFVY